MASEKKNSIKTTRKRVVKKAASSKKITFHTDANHTQFLKKIGKRTSEQAIREAQALGLEIMYIENDILYREKDGKREVVENLKLVKSSKNLILKKGITLYVK